MKKLIALFLLLSVYSSKLPAQEMKFVTTYAEAVSKASAENKRIFIDISTSWCGPCKDMEKNTFTNKEVVEFFNKNFICLKIDAEKGEGIALAKKYGAQAYPTLVFLDCNGSFLYKETGAPQPQQLIAWASKEIDPSAKNLEELTKVYESGKMKLCEMKDYMSLMRKAGLSANNILDTYLKKLPKKELFKEGTYKEICKNNITFDDNVFMSLVNNRSKFIKSINKTDFDGYLYRIFLFKAYGNINNKKSNDDYFESLRKLSYPYTKAVIENIELVIISQDKTRTDEYIERAKKLFKECPYSLLYVCSEGIKHGWGNNDKIEAFMTETIKDYAKVNPKGALSLIDSYISLYIINANDWVKANGLMDLAVAVSGDKNYDREFALEIKRTLGLVNCEKYGQDAPDFNLPTNKGDRISLSDYRGKYVLLDFWASWCTPCKEELPFIRNAYNKYTDNGLVIISISSDSDTIKWKNAILNDKMGWNNVIIENQDILTEYDAQSIPRIVLISPDGKIIADKLRGNTIESELKKNLNK